MKEWRLIIDGPLSGYENMAVDEAMLTACEKGESPSTIRFYKWDRTTLSIGFFQKSEACFKRCSALNIPIVRRVTGGRAVLHDVELTYSVVTNDAELLEKGIIGAYKVVSRCIVDALMDLGLDACIMDARDKRFASKGKTKESCFDFVSRYEITINGRKIIGSAQKRLKNAFLQHGSIIMDVNKDLQMSIFDTTDASMIDGINSYIDVDADSVIESILKRFGETMDVKLINGRLTDFEFALKEGLTASKYTICGH
ncbi:MAG: lipoate--protein ligase family protein [Deltaproteobacteria bacterium]|nr:lipoate--protein ligase family protein [Deltaproteobacteria bacterium]